MKNYIRIGFFAMIAILQQSCNKELNVSNEFIDLTEDQATQQDLLESNEVEVSEQVEASFSAVSTRTYPTRTWSAPKGTYPNTLTVDYGSMGVVGPYGHIRKGKMLITLTAPINTVNAIRTVEHDNFYIDEVKVEGTVYLTNKGLNTFNQPYFDRVVSNRKLTFPGGKSLYWNAIQTITQIEGFNTPLNKFDNVFTITDVSSGVNRIGKTFAITTSIPLVYKTICAWVVEGIVNISVDQKSITVNYGDGSCNNEASVTLPNGTVIEVKIRRWW